MPSDGFRVTSHDQIEEWFIDKIWSSLCRAYDYFSAHYHRSAIAFFTDTLNAIAASPPNYNDSTYTKTLKTHISLGPSQQLDARCMKASLLFHIAQCYLSQSDITSAIAALEDTISVMASLDNARSIFVEMKLSEALSAAATIATDTGRYEYAVLLWERVCELRVNPASVDNALVQMAIAYLGIGMHTTSIKIFAHITQVYPTADLFILLAKLYKLQGDVNAMHECLIQTIDLNPSHLELKDLIHYVAEVATSYTAEAENQSLHGHLEMALLFLARAQTLDPDDVFLGFKHGQILSQLGRHEESIRYLEEMKQGMQPLIDTYLNQKIDGLLAKSASDIGLASMREGKLRDAIGRFDYAISKASSISSYYKQRADCHLALGNRQIALEDYLEFIYRIDNENNSNSKFLSPIQNHVEVDKKVTSEDIDNVRGIIAKIYYECAEREFTEMNLDKCLQFADLAIRYQPNMAEPWFIKGRAKLLMKDVDAAIEFLTQTIRLDPTHAESLALLQDFTVPLNSESKTKPNFERGKESKTRRKKETQDKEFQLTGKQFLPHLGVAMGGTLTKIQRQGTLKNKGAI